MLQDDLNVVHPQSKCLGVLLIKFLDLLQLPASLSPWYRVLGIFYGSVFPTDEFNGIHLGALSGGRFVKP